MAASQRPSGCGWRCDSARSASEGSLPRRDRRTDAGGIHLGELLLQVVEKLQHLVDRCAAGRRDQLAQLPVAFVDLMAGRKRRRRTGLAGKQRGKSRGLRHRGR